MNMNAKTTPRIKINLEKVKYPMTAAFNPTFNTFKTFSVSNYKALPFGMAMGKYGYLWVAEHTTNKIAVINPTTGSSMEIAIPRANPFIQFLTSDSKGNIWFAEQRGDSLGVITY